MSEHVSGLWPLHKPPSFGIETLAVVREMFLLMHTVSTHGADHPLTQGAAGALAGCLREARPPFSLQFLGQAVFRDTVLLPLDLSTFGNAQEVGQALKNLHVEEISFQHEPERADLLRFGSVLARGMAGPSDLLSKLDCPGVRWREILGITDADQRVVDPAVFALTQILLALEEARRLPAGAGEPWPWGYGVGVIRRLERAVQSDPAASIRVNDHAPGDWGVARRALTAALDVLLVLESLQVGEATRRATAHAALILGMAGFRERGGIPLQASAQAALSPAIEAPVVERRGIDPHRLRTSAILDGLARPGSSQAPRVASLVDLVYELARARCPESLPFPLSRADLLAMASLQSGRRFDADWVAALVSVCGPVPPGACVRTADGRLACAMGPGAPGDPFRPKVLVDGTVLVPDQPVTLLSAAALQCGT